MWDTIFFSHLGFAPLLRIDGSIFHSLGNSWTLLAFNKHQYLALSVHTKLWYQFVKFSSILIYPSWKVSMDFVLEITTNKLFFYTGSKIMLKVGILLWKILFETSETPSVFYLYSKIKCVNSTYVDPFISSFCVKSLPLAIIFVLPVQG